MFETRIMSATSATVRKRTSDSSFAIPAPAHADTRCPTPAADCQQCDSCDRSAVATLGPALGAVKHPSASHPFGWSAICLIGLLVERQLLHARHDALLGALQFLLRGLDRHPGIVCGLCGSPAHPVADLRARPCGVDDG